MLSRSEREELKKLRKTVYGRTAEDVDAATLDRLAELEASARAQNRRALDSPQIAQANEGCESAAMSDVRASVTHENERHPRPRTWPVLIVVAVSFAAGVLVGTQPEWLVGTLPTADGAGPAIPLSGEQQESYHRVTASQRWDHPEQVSLVGSAEGMHAWLGMMADGKRYCVATDERAVVTLLCQNATALEPYPLRFEWVSPNTGVSLHLRIDKEGASIATIEVPETSHS